MVAAKTKHIFPSQGLWHGLILFDVIVESRPYVFSLCYPKGFLSFSSYGFPQGRRTSSPSTKWSGDGHSWADYIYSLPTLYGAS